jgi:hypothetical protein
MTSDAHDVVFTCDVDWAPEYAIEDTVSFFLDLGVPLTAFATHDSPVLRQSGIDVGIHPYLSREHERDHSRVIGGLKELYPDARGSRSHRNFFGYTTPGLLAEHGLEYDISVVTWGHPCLINQHFSGIKTLTYSWEDGLHFDYGLDLDAGVMPHGDGPFVYNVHPVVIFLNADSEERRKHAVRGVSDLTVMEHSALAPHINRGYGIKNLLTDFMVGRGASALRTLL